jgi:iron complex transport system substrate-binding protein
MPLRVVSLLPAATEMVCALGAKSLLVGRSHECDYPPGLSHLPVLTGARMPDASPADIDRAVRASLAEQRSLYDLFADRLAALRPDIIITQDVCDVCSVDLAAVRRVALALPNAPRVISLNPTTIEGVLDDILFLGHALDMPAEGERAVVQLRERFFAANEFVNPFDDGPSLAFLEWTDPLFCAGHWTVQLIERAGARHPLNPTVPKENAGAAAGPQFAERVAGPSFAIAPEALLASAPERLVIAPCGFGLERAMECARELSHQAWWAEVPAVQRGRVAVVDGNQMFNRPGPRLVDAYEWLVCWLQDRPTDPAFPWVRFA